MYKAIIFDFFDVIAPDFYRVWLEANGYSREGAFLAIAQSIDNGRIALEDYYNRLSQLSGQSPSAIQGEFENKTAFNEDILRLITILHEHYKTGLVTNSPADLVRRILRANQLEDNFDAIVISGEIGFAKPDQRIFDRALRELGISAHQAIFIDDLTEYVEAAEKAGLTGIQFLEAEQLKNELEKLGIILSSG